MVIQWCEDLRQDYLPTYVSKVCKNPNGYYVDYYDGGRLQVIKAHEHMCGYRFNALMLDKDVPRKIKEECMFILQIDYCEQDSPNLQDRVYINRIENILQVDLNVNLEN